MVTYFIQCVIIHYYRYFPDQIIIDFANESFFRLVSISFWHVLNHSLTSSLLSVKNESVNFLNLKIQHYLVLFPAPILESNILPKSLSSFEWKLILRNQILEDLWEINCCLIHPAHIVLLRELKLMNTLPLTLYSYLSLSASAPHFEVTFFKNQLCSIINTKYLIRVHKLINW